MNNVIEVLAKSVYGNVLLYPINDQAQLLARLMRTKTLSTSALQIAREMGFTVNVTGDAAKAAVDALL